VNDEYNMMYVQRNTSLGKMPHFLFVNEFTTVVTKKVPLRLMLLLALCIYTLFDNDEFAGFDQDYSCRPSSRCQNSPINSLSLH
jgi:hypothetical protein